MCGLRAPTTVSGVTVGPCIGMITSCGPRVVTNLRASLRRWIYRDLPIPACWEVTTLTYDLWKKERKVHTLLLTYFVSITHLSRSTTEAAAIALLGPFFKADSGHLLKCPNKYSAKLASDGKVEYGRR